MRSSWRRTSSGVFVDDVGLGLRMQDNQESCSKRSVMAMSCNLEPAAHELSSSSFRPKFYGTGNHVTCFGDINDVVSASGTGSTDAITVSKSLQYPYFTSDSSLFTFNSSGEMTPSVNERVLFTAAQWQELERQTTIYNYMMASVPVPPELLMPITKNQSNVLPPKANTMEMQKNDGKKWRCSRDVAPDQKYCERHSHKSRPRSRKPVELHSHDSLRTLTNNNTTPTITIAPLIHTCLIKNLTFQTIYLCFLVPWPLLPTHMISPGENLPVASNHSPEWQHLKRDGIKGNGKVYNLYREEQPLCSNTYRGGHSLQAQRLNDHCSMFSSPKSNSLERALNPSMTEAQETRHFIDAWSLIRGETTLAGWSKKKWSPQLSSFGIMGSWDSHHQSVSGLRPQWMTSHGGSWMVSPPGGPLAEALCLGISSNAKTASNLPSPCSSSCGPNVDQNQLI
ncbi:growth-regulating factor [Salix suchowensis]|nr:growth-regulating factor [Salix suchowensis]